MHKDDRQASHPIMQQCRAAGLAGALRVGQGTVNLLVDTAHTVIPQENLGAQPEQLPKAGALYCTHTAGAVANTISYAGCFWSACVLCTAENCSMSYFLPRHAPKSPVGTGTQATQQLHTGSHAACSGFVLGVPSCERILCWALLLRDVMLSSALQPVAAMRSQLRWAIALHFMM